MMAGPLAVVEGQQQGAQNEHPAWGWGHAQQRKRTCALANKELDGLYTWQHALTEHCAMVSLRGGGFSSSANVSRKTPQPRPNQAQPSRLYKQYKHAHAPIAHQPPHNRTARCVHGGVHTAEADTGATYAACSKLHTTSSSSPDTCLPSSKYGKQQVQQAASTASRRDLQLAPTFAETSTQLLPPRLPSY